MIVKYKNSVIEITNESDLDFDQTNSQTVAFQFSSIHNSTILIVWTTILIFQFCKLASAPLRFIVLTDYQTQNWWTENKTDRKIKAHNKLYNALCVWQFGWLLPYLKVHKICSQIFTVWKVKKLLHRFYYLVNWKS